jgi:hypothetical protein
MKRNEFSLCPGNLIERKEDGASSTPSAAIIGAGRRDVNVHDAIRHRVSKGIPLKGFTVK